MCGGLEACGGATCGCVDQPPPAGVDCPTNDDTIFFPLQLPVQTASNENDCGGCGIDCASGETCDGGTCVASGAPDIAAGLPVDTWALDRPRDRVYFLSGDDLYAVPADGSTAPVLLATDPDVTDFKMSASTVFAYPTVNPGELLAIPKDGSAPFTVPYDGDFASLTPVGDHLYFNDAAGLWAQPIGGASFLALDEQVGQMVATDTLLAVTVPAPDHAYPPTGAGPQPEPPIDAYLVLVIDDATQSYSALSVCQGDPFHPLDIAGQQILSWSLLADGNDIYHKVMWRQTGGNIKRHYLCGYAGASVGMTYEDFYAQSYSFAQLGVQGITDSYIYWSLPSLEGAAAIPRRTLRCQGGKVESSDVPAWMTDVRFGTNGKLYRYGTGIRVEPY